MMWASILIIKKTIINMKVTAEIIENKVEQLEVALDGVLDRMKAFETRLKEVTEGNVLYVDAERALVSSRPEDLAYIREQVRAGNPRFKEYSR